MGAPLDREACLRYQDCSPPGSSTATARPRRSGTPSCARPTCPSTPARPAAPAPTTTWPSSGLRRALRGARRAGRPGRPGGRRGDRPLRQIRLRLRQQPEEQGARFRDGWLYIGDLATWDADGYVTIVGRKDDMIITGGENVHPTQVEAVLDEHPKVVGVGRRRPPGRALGRAGRRLRDPCRTPGARGHRAGTPHPRPPDARAFQAPAGISLRRRDPADGDGQEASLQGP